MLIELPGLWIASPYSNGAATGVRGLEPLVCLSTEVTIASRIVETYARICGDVELHITETFRQPPGVGRDAFVCGVLPGGKTVADAATIVSLWHAFWLDLG